MQCRLNIIGLLALATLASAQTVVLFGALSNFDAVNDCGHDSHGFEIELHGVSSVTYTFPTRFGTATQIPIPGGVIVRWASRYDSVNDVFPVKTPSMDPAAPVTPTNGHQCISSPYSNQAIACDHFGVGTPYYQNTITSSSYSWLIRDAGNSSALTRSSCYIGIPHPSVNVYVQNALPAVAQVIQLPPPPPPPVFPNCVPGRVACNGECRSFTSDNANCGACNNACQGTDYCLNGVCEVTCDLPLSDCGNKCVDKSSDNKNCGSCGLQCAVGSQCRASVCVEQYGDAQWVKSYKTEHGQEVILEQLVTDNVLVPQEPATIEVEWTLLQKSPPSGNHNGNRNGGPSDVLNSNGNVNSGSRSVVRRWEFFKYAGVYNAVDHSATCADGLCNAPAPEEIGNYIGAQMAAANIGVPGVGVVLAGPRTGTVTDSTGAINCRANGNLCSAFFALNAAATLTATTPSGAVFAGWTGGCVSAAASCTVNVNEQIAVTATWKTLYNLGAKNAVQTSALALGQTVVFSCATTSCSGKIAEGEVITFNAVIPAGKTFASWSGKLCTGTLPTVTVRITGDTTCQANFR